MFQSYFWVPTYDEQTRGNPERLVEFISASSGDAAILNPILSADSASSEIESKVFEGLIDRDEHLNFRGRIAKSWDINEEAYFYINEEKNISIKKIIKRISSIPEVTKIEILPEQNKTVTYTFNDKKLKIQMNLPKKLKVTLSYVEPNFFNQVKGVLGSDYFHHMEPAKFVEIKGKDLSDNEREKIRKKFFTPFEHNPVIVFHLRKKIFFHDGYKLTAEDVKFTYEAIMDPKNLSPRISDFEPIKKVKVIDPYTVKVIYKRLYSPALSAWSIGILPKHLLDNEALKKEAI
ncbi:ABC transporter substrate-binding protein, partial [Desulfothermus sp.]